MYLKIVIVNNSTNSNKIKDHLLHQIIQHHQKTTSYEVGRLNPVVRQAQNNGGLKPFNGIPHLPY